jgi:hypothetical protein
MNKPQTHNGDLGNLPPALLPLTEQNRWVVWPWRLRTTKDGRQKWTKPPRMVWDPSRNARSNDSSTWGGYQAAVDAVKAGNADGIGYMLFGSSIGAIDLDHCVDQNSAKLDLWAEQLHEEANGAYQETTVSGCGLRIIGTIDRGGPEVHRKFTFDRKTGAGVELYRNTARYITISGLERGSCATLPSLDNFIDTLFGRYTGQARHGGELDFNDAGPQSAPDYDNLIRNGAPEGERSEAFQAVVWHLAGQGWTAEAIADELAKHPNGIGAKYADRLHDEVTRSYEKWRTRKRLEATGDPTTANDPWPQIFIIPGELPRIVDEAETALLGLRREIYQRGGLIVRPVLSRLNASDDRETQGWHLIPLTQPSLAEAFTCAARFVRFDGRAKAWIATDVPDKVAEAYLARQGTWKLPVLTGIIGTPFLRDDGTIHETPGYDATSGLLYKPDCKFPQIPQHPTKDDALQALKFIETLLVGFPFVTPADRSVALSAILTALDRYGMATAPLHAFTAPAAGTGKSLLVDIAATFATGRSAPVIAQGGTEEELEKRLGAALLAGDPVISIDNCEHVLQSAFLCQALTQQTLNIRMLGFSRNVETPIAATIFATGNNLVIAGDLTRRTLLCRVDARCEHPERRYFGADPLFVAKAKRSRLVAAALTVLKAGLISDELIKLPPFGSFERWSQRIRAPLLWLGQADPCDTTIQVQAEDPKLLSLAAVMTQWREHLGTGIEHTVQQIINRALNAHDFHVALLNVAVARSGNVISNDRLGRWLKRVEGRINNGLMLKCMGKLDGYPVWSLRTLSGLSGV